MNKNSEWISWTIETTSIRYIRFLFHSFQAICRINSFNFSSKDQKNSKNICNGVCVRERWPTPTTTTTCFKSHTDLHLLNLVVACTYTISFNNQREKKQHIVRATVCILEPKWDRNKNNINIQLKTILLSGRTSDEQASEPVSVVYVRFFLVVAQRKKRRASICFQKSIF